MEEGLVGGDRDVARHPKVFISYSHDSDGHRSQVLALSEHLRRAGIDTRIDQYEPGTPAAGWPRWMLDQLEWADFVLVVCTPSYYRRFRGRETGDVGKGAAWEGLLITHEMYDQRAVQTKFVPISFTPGQRPFIPEPLRGHTHYLMTWDDAALQTPRGDFERLCDFLIGRAGFRPAPLGELTPTRRAPSTRTPGASPWLLEPRRSWKLASVVVSLIGLAWVGAKAPWSSSSPSDAATSTASRALEPESMARLARDRLTVPDGMRPRLDEVLRRLEDIVISNRHDEGPWMLGQQIVALDQLPQAPTDWKASAILDEIDETCACWQKTLLKYGTRPHHAATIWALLGLGRLGAPIPERVLSYLLRAQSTSGAWGLVPTREKPPSDQIVALRDETVASTYVTAFAVLALSELLERGLIAEPQRAAATTAREHGALWLFRKRESGAASWKDFPSHANARGSLAISGLAFHALFVASRAAPAAQHSVLTPAMMQELSRAWAGALPPELPPLDDTEKKSEIFVSWPRLDEVNDVFQTPTPWLLIATADAFASGTRETRQQLLEWLDRSLPTLPLDAPALAKVNAWHASEGTIGLRYLLGEPVI